MGGQIPQASNTTACVRAGALPGVRVGSTKQGPARPSVECTLSRGGRQAGRQERKQGRAGSQTQLLLVMLVLLLGRQVGRTQGQQQHHQHWACLR